MVQAIVEYAKSAFKHGITEADILHAILNPVYDEIQDDGDDKRLLLGFDCIRRVCTLRKSPYQNNNHAIHGGVLIEP